MFNKNLKRIRLENNLTQKEVADFLHISPQSISKWENGESTTSIDFLPMLRNFSNVQLMIFSKKITLCQRWMTLKSSFRFSNILRKKK